MTFSLLAHRHLQHAAIARGAAPAVARAVLREPAGYTLADVRVALTTLSDIAEMESSFAERERAIDAVLAHLDQLEETAL